MARPMEENAANLFFRRYSLFFRRCFAELGRIKISLFHIKMGRMAEWLLNKKIMDQRDNHATEVYQTLAPMSERSSGRSRGFGYVTFAEAEDAKKEMRSSSKKITRIFVARIPLSVTEAAFRRWFFTIGEILDLYMPKDPSTKGHCRIGFLTFANADSVDNLMFETHELGGSDVVVDRAAPKEDNFRPVSRMLLPPPLSGGYGVYNAYVTTRYAALDLGAPTACDYPSSVYGKSARRKGKKIFIGRLPEEASVEDLRLYFGRFGRILDVYIPKIWSHGFGFVTFVEDGVADRVSRRSHKICGKQVAIDSATPLDDGGQAEAEAAAAIWTTHLNQRTKAMVLCELKAECMDVWILMMQWGYGGMCGSMGRVGGLGWMGGGMDSLSGSMGGLSGGMGSVGGNMGGGRPSRTDYRYRPVLESLEVSNITTDVYLYIVLLGMMMSLLKKLSSST
ncbi:putative RNA recognition motif domain, nucleotide-binding alpha-beta plait domain superfamily [Helianthus anomalus]